MQSFNVAKSDLEAVQYENLAEFELQQKNKHILLS